MISAHHCYLGLRLHTNTWVAEMTLHPQTYAKMSVTVSCQLIPLNQMSRMQIQPTSMWIQSLLSWFQRAPTNKSCNFNSVHLGNNSEQFMRNGIESIHSCTTYLHFYCLVAEKHGLGRSTVVFVPNHQMMHSPALFWEYLERRRSSVYVSSSSARKVPHRYEVGENDYLTPSQDSKQLTLF